ncbi:MAG: hypothetical protein BWZ09_00883 [Alphaproteobacteria bacterium ADurb.BinA305]|nr:MAG: hypothetical protein BWZ09_00883 [Alphaproteobacteria bacterium ADurb.BinA305]
MAIASSAARAMCAAPLPRDRPSRVPRACGSQYGAPSPVKAGTSTTPPLSGTLAAKASTSDARFTSPRPSRNHCTTAPPMNTLPSSA